MFPHFSQMKIVPRTGAFVVFLKSRARQITSALQVTTIIKSLFNQINPNYMRKISGEFFIEKHLTQETDLLNSPIQGGIVNFALVILQSSSLARSPTPGGST